MQPQASIVPPFAGTGVSFDSPVDMEAKTASEAEASATDPLDQSAVDFRKKWQNQNVVAGAGTATFTPNWNGSGAPSEGLSFCCYKFTPGSAAGAPRQTLRLQWDPEQRLDDVQRQCCLGISDYTRNGWEWFAGPADGTLTMESLQPYIGSDGQLLVMVIVMGQQQAALERVTLGAPELRGGGWLDDEQFIGEADSGEEEDRVGSVTFPATFDRSGGMPDVRDQGLRAAASAFAVADGAFGYELDRIYASSGWVSSSDFHRASARYLYVLADQGLTPPTCDQLPRSVSGVLNYLKLNGVATEARAPYNTADFCNRTFSATAIADASLLKISSFSTIAGQSLTTVDSIKSKLFSSNRLVVFGLKIDQDFLNYQPGEVWDFSGPVVGSDALAIVGWDDSKLAFKVRNSWGKSWGDDGYAYVSYHMFLTTTGAQITTLFSLTHTFNQAVVDRFAPLALPPPTNVQATDGTFSDRVRVTWNTVPGAGGYAVFRSTSLNGNYAFVGATGTQTFDDIQPVTTPFFYKVHASDGQGVLSLLSTANSGHAGLAAPDGVAGTAGTFPDHIRVTWNSVPGSPQYKVFRASASNGTYSLIGTTPGNGTTFDDFEPTTNTFFYKVKAIAGSGDSALSVSPGSGNASVPAPTGLTAVSGTDSVTLTWNEVPNADGYVLFRGATAAGPFEGIFATNGSPTRLDERFSLDTAFYFVKTEMINGSNNVVTSAPSASVSGAATLAGPPGITATQGTLTDRVRLTWNAHPQDNGINTQYLIYRGPSNGAFFSHIATLNTSATGQLQFDDIRQTTEDFVYGVKARIGNVRSVFGGTATGHAGLAAPTFLLMDDPQPDMIRMEWQAVAGVSRYRVFRSEEGGAFVLADAVEGTSFTDEVGVSPNHDGIFGYKVKAFSAR